jgi:hypothetical protein
MRICRCELAIRWRSEASCWCTCDDAAGLTCNINNTVGAT